MKGWVAIMASRSGTWRFHPLSSLPSFLLLLLFPPSSFPSQILQSDPLSKQFPDLSWELRQLWEPWQEDSTRDSGQRVSLTDAVIRVLIVQDYSFTVPVENGVSEGWDAGANCLQVAGFLLLVQFVSGAPLEIVPGSIHPLEGRAESLALCCALSGASFPAVCEVTAENYLSSRGRGAHGCSLGAQPCLGSRARLQVLNKLFFPCILRTLCFGKQRLKLCFSHN